MEVSISLRIKGLTLTLATVHSEEARGVKGSDQFPKRHPRYELVLVCFWASDRSASYIFLSIDSKSVTTLHIGLKTIIHELPELSLFIVPPAFNL